MDGSGNKDSRGEEVDVNLGLALSGGGVRAALFSLGVVLGLVETGANRWIRSIASVSGGSILNATLAHGDDLSDLSSGDFRERAGQIARVLSERGVFALSPGNLLIAFASGLRFLARLAMSLAGGLFVLVIIIRDNGWRPTLPRVEIPWLIVLYATLGTAIVLFVLLRGRLQEAKYAALLGGLTAKTRPRLESFTDSKILHVLVSTDLLSGCPVYFSRAFAFCQPYGWSMPGKLSTATALYASAAFPVIFPPRKLPTRHFDFQNGESPGFRPKSLKLADGGVYNNLGYDWLDELGRQPDELWPYGALEVGARETTAQPLLRMVVNASAPSRQIERLSRGAVARTMSVLYDNTVKPRLEQIRREGGLLIDISQSPLELAEWLEKRYQKPLVSQPQGAEKLRRATAIRKALTKRSKEYWSRLKRETAGTKTKLSSAGRETAAALMHHGYLSTMVLMFVEFGRDLPALKKESPPGKRKEGRLRQGGGPPRLLDERAFLDLAGPRSSGFLKRFFKKPEPEPVTGQQGSATNGADAGPGRQEKAGA